MAEKNNHLDLSRKLFTLLVVFLVGLFSFWGFRIYEIWKTTSGNNPREISVEGQGKAYIVPDVAKVVLGTTANGAASDVLVSENTKKVNEIIKVVKALGIAEEDIKTVNYNLSPRYVWDSTKGNVPDGFTIDQSIEVKIRDFDKIGELLAQTAKAGANNTGGLTFIVDNEDKAKAEARKEAIKKAKTKASEIAGQTGLKLGKVIYFNEYTNNPGYYYDEASVKSFSTPEAAMDIVDAPIISPGQNEINVTVNLTYRVY